MPFGTLDYSEANLSDPKVNILSTHISSPVVFETTIKQTAKKMPVLSMTGSLIHPGMRQERWGKKTGILVGC